MLQRLQKLAEIMASLSEQEAKGKWRKAEGGRWKAFYRKIMHRYQPAFIH
jgi:hypothetical protein